MLIKENFLLRVQKKSAKILTMEAKNQKKDGYWKKMAQKCLVGLCSQRAGQSLGNTAQSSC